MNRTDGGELEVRLLDLFASDVQVDMSRRILKPDRDGLERHFGAELFNDVRDELGRCLARQSVGGDCRQIRHQQTTGGCQ